MTRVCPKCGYIDPYWRNCRWCVEVEVANLGDVEIPESLEDEYFVYKIPSNKKTTNPVVYRVPKVVFKAFGSSWKNLKAENWDSNKYQRKLEFLRKQTKFRYPEYGYF